jgi:hypothetical protein
MADYDNYDLISWALGTPITAGRLQQVSTNISEVKSATDKHAKGVLILEEFTSPVGTVDSDGVLHTGLTGTVTTIANLNDGVQGNQTITLEAARWYKVSLTLPDLTISSGHSGSYFLIEIAKTVSSTTTVIGRFNVMTSSSAATTRFFGGGTYSTIIDTGAGNTTPHEFKATVTHTGRDATNTNAYAVTATASSPLQFWVEDVGASA